MIIVKLWGGLGNQLFQYSFGFCLAKERKENIIFDISYYDNQAKQVARRDYKLSLLKIPFDNSCKYQRTFIINLLQNKYFNKFIRIFPKFCIPIGKNTLFIKETRKKVMDLDISNGKNLYLDGYWQSAYYFRKYKSELIKMFVPNYDITDEVKDLIRKIDGCESVAVHIRRGDFTNKTYKKIGHFVNSKYYHESIDYLKNIKKNAQFFFFSDDIEWVREEFGPDKNYNYVDLKHSIHSDIDDLTCMSKCKHNIISASTFSWWGAWLKESNDNSIVIAPKGMYFNECFLESNWIRI